MQNKTMMSRMISVVVPSYNEEMNIVKCLKFLNNQSIPRKDYEIIVVDGHSNDKTVQLAKKYADKVIMQKSKGVGGARNDGVAVAKGDIIATTDADCIAPENWLERIKLNFEDKDTVFAYGAVYLLTKKIYYRLFSKIGNFICSLLYFSGLAQPANGCNMAVRTDVFKKIQGYKFINVLDDYELSLRVKKFGKLKYDSKQYIYTSTRRMEQEGILKVHYIWGINAVRLLLGKDVQNIKYSKQNYDE